MFIDAHLYIALCLFFVGALRIIKYAKFATKVGKANVRTRYKALGTTTAAVGIFTGACCCFFSFVFFFLYLAFLFLDKLHNYAGI